MKKVFFNFLILLVLVLPSYLMFLGNKNQIKSASMTNLRDQLSNAQLSFFGRVGTTEAPPTSIINIATSGNPSNNSGNLSPGDTIAISMGAGSSVVDILNINDNNSIIVSDSEIASAANTGEYIIATRSATHTISFTPDYDATNTNLIFMIQASDLSGELTNDGIPDQGGFDLGTLTPSDVTCPDGTTAEAIAVQDMHLGIIYDGYYQSILCSGIDITQGVGISAVIGIEGGNQLINPSPGRNHIIGQASDNSDTYWYGIVNSDSEYNTLSVSLGKIAVTESVRISATVEPILTFTIGTSGTTSVGQTLCGSPLSVGASNTTITSVDFGLLSLSTENNLAQKLSCITNSVNGYTIQAYENNPLATILNETIPNTDCDSNGCSSTIETPWNSFSNSGFGYSLEVGTTTGEAANVSIGITTVGNYKAFGVGSSNSEILWQRSDIPAGTDSVYICYRVVAGAGQAPGNYFNSVNFIATATF